LDTDTAVATAQTGRPALNQIVLTPFRRALGAHGAMWERLRNGIATKSTASKTVATMAVVLTDGARSTDDRARMMWMPMMAVVGKNASAPSAAGTVWGIAISLGFQSARIRGAEMRVR
jgi:hypothetical protein